MVVAQYMRKYISWKKVEDISAQSPSFSMHCMKTYGVIIV